MYVAFFKISTVHQELKKTENVHKECCRNTSHILNSYLSGASEFGPVVMVTPSNKCLTIFFSNTIINDYGLNHSTQQFMSYLS